MRLEDRPITHQTSLMEKIPCNECGALILPTTAENTGGVCMACKQGIRKSMEASRAYYQSLKAYDPFRELWKSLVERSSEDEALISFSREERSYFAVSLLNGEVYNGGFDQFFSNSSGNHYVSVIEGLQDLGALSSLRLAREAADTIFGRRAPPADRAKRWQIMNGKARQLSEVLDRYRHTSKLERLDKQFCEDPDKLEERLTAYAERHRLVAPFLKDPDAS
jgi:hypothetical protein